MRRLDLAICITLGSTGCGDCTQNAVLIANEVRALGEIVDTIEVYGDANGDGAFTRDERAFVVDPRPEVPKILRIAFLTPVPRSALCVGCVEPFLELFALPPITVSIQATYFNDDPNDVDPNGPPTAIVTYRFADDLRDPAVTGNVAVSVNVNLPLINAAYGRGRFLFILARETPPTGPPPRIVAVTPDAPGRLAWGRPIEQSDFAPGCFGPSPPGTCLTDVLALADANFLGTTLLERVAPHQTIDLTFDRPMTNLLLSVTPSGIPQGLQLSATTFFFTTPFTTASSDTSLGLAPDATYEVETLSKWGIVHAPVVTGTQSAQGQFLMPNFSDAVYAALRAAGFADDDLYGDTMYRFRTGPFRITYPAHRGETNATTAPAGQLIGHLQFAAPTGIDSPSTIDIAVTAEAATTTTTIAFPPGGPDSIDQDGILRGEVVGGMDVSVHDVPLQLPAADFDGVVEIEMLVFAAPQAPAPIGELLGRDKIRLVHDVIVPEIAPDQIEVTNDYTDGQLDHLCVVADCDVETFQIQVAGGQPVTIDAASAATTACVGDTRRYCFSNVSLGIPGTAEGETIVTIVAIDDQGNVSAPVTVVTTPRCRLFEKFVGVGGRRLASAQLPSGPAVAWDQGRTLRYAEPAVDGNWTRRAGAIYTIPQGHTFGLGIDMIVDPVSQQPTVCFVDAEVTTTDVQSAGTLRVMQLRPDGTWAERDALGGVRPIGCSLSVLQSRLVVGWVEPDPHAPAGGTNGVPRWGFVGSISLLAGTLPIPTDVQGDPLPHSVPRELVLTGAGSELYFAYRVNKPFSPISAPGVIVAGSLIGGIYHVETVCPSGSFCESLDPVDTDAYVGFGPRLVVDGAGIVLGFIRRRPGIPDFQFSAIVLHSPPQGADLKFDFSVLRAVPLSSIDPSVATSAGTTTTAIHRRLPPTPAAARSITSAGSTSPA